MGQELHFHVKTFSIYAATAVVLFINYASVLQASMDLRLLLGKLGKNTTNDKHYLINLDECDSFLEKLDIAKVLVWGFSHCYNKNVRVSCILDHVDWNNNIKFTGN